MKLSDCIYFRGKPLTDVLEPGTEDVFEFSTLNRQLSRGGKRVADLEPQQAEVLALLLSNPGVVLPEAKFAERLWNREDEPASSGQIIRTHVSKLRQLLKDSKTEPRFIETVNRAGYVFAGVVVNPDTPKKGWRSKRVVGGALIAAASIAVIVGFGRDFRIWPVKKPATVASRAPETTGRLFAGLFREGTVRRIGLAKVPNDVAISAGGDFLYAVLEGADSVVEVDLKQARVRRQIAVGGAPLAIVLSKDGRSAFVGDRYNGLSIVDIESGSVNRIPTNGIVHDLALSPDGSRLYLALVTKGLGRLDLASRELITIGGVVCPMAFDSGASSDALWISTQCGTIAGHDRIEVMDFATERIVATHGRGAPIVGGALVTHSGVDQAWIDGNDACLAPEYDHQGCPSAVSGGILHAIRMSDGFLLRSIAVPHSGALRISPDGRFVVHSAESGIHVFNTGSLRLVEYVDLAAHSVHFSEKRPELYLIPAKIPEIQIVALPPLECRASIDTARTVLSGDGMPSTLFNNANAEFRGDVGYGRGILGQAFQFGGQKSVIDLGDGSHDIYIENTLSFWIRPTSPEGRHGLEVLSERTGSPDASRFVVARRADDRIELRLFPPNGGEPREIVSKTAARPNVWNSIFLNYASGRFALFVNGEPQGELPNELSATDRAGRLRFGGSVAGKNYFVGSIDEIMDRSRALSPSEIREEDRLQRWCYEGNWRN